MEKSERKRMIQSYSKLKSADNSGARLLRVIRVMGRGEKKEANAGDVVIASVKEAIPNAPIKKKQVIRAVVVRTVAPIKRSSGIVVRFDDDAAVLIDSDGLPKGTRIFGPVAAELREKGYSKIISMSNEVI